MLTFEAGFYLLWKGKIVPVCVLEFFDSPLWQFALAVFATYVVHYLVIIQYCT